MKRILVLGAGGYLGSHLCRYLKFQGHVVIGCDQEASKTSWHDVTDEWIAGDIRKPELIRRLWETEPHVLINMISLDHFLSERNVEETCSINVLPSWAILQDSKDKRLEKFIYFSTIQVFGAISPGLIGEEIPKKPSNLYGLSHVISEEIVKYYDRKLGFRCLTLRLSNGYGEPVFKDANCWWLVINDLVKTAFSEQKIELKSDGSPQRDFLNVRDICRAVEFLIMEKNEDLDHNVFHLASGTTRTILEIACLVRSVYEGRYQRRLPVFVQGVDWTESDSSGLSSAKFTIDIGRLKKLGFVPSVDLRDGIAGLFAYLEKQSL
jgi:nucleoside-diphosphate-sugar epimerase